jgi:hypothetical protein
MPAAPSNLATDEIVVVREGFAAQRVKITQQSMVIGRDEDCDIPLDSQKISRHHARLDKLPNGTYTLTDLGSTNGTFMDGAKLLANVAEPWQPAQIVSIGEFRLSLQRASRQANTEPAGGVYSLGGVQSVGAAQPAGSLMGGPQPPQASSPVKAQPAAAKVSIQLIPPQLKVEPGMRADAQIEIFNQSDLVEHFRVQVQGVPVEWVILPQSVVQLMPGTRGALPLTFHPPRLPSTTAGTYNFGLRVSSEERGMEIARGSGVLAVNPFKAFRVDMSPKRLRKATRAKFSVSNQGNLPETFTISGRDREEALRFQPPHASLNVGPGRTETAEFIVRPLKRMLIGSPKIYPLEMRAEATSGEQQMESGELAASPLLPIWVLGLLTALCAICVAVGAFLFSQQNEQRDEERRETAQAAREESQLLTAEFRTQEAQATQTAVAQLSSAQQTQFAQTAQAQGTATQAAIEATLTGVAQQSGATQTAFVQQQSATAQALTLAFSGTLIFQTQAAAATQTVLQQQAIAASQTANALTLTAIAPNPGLGTFQTTFTYAGEMVDVVYGPSLGSQKVCAFHNIPLFQTDIGKELRIYVNDLQIAYPSGTYSQPPVTLILYRSRVGAWQSPQSIDMWQTQQAELVAEQSDPYGILIWTVNQAGNYVLCLETYVNDYYSSDVQFQFASYSAFLTE